jgi:hypothetical protein
MEKKQGLGMSPRPSSEHQMAILVLMHQINATYCFKNIVATPEEELYGPNSRTPDITIWTLNKNGNKHHPVLTIEIVKDKRSFNYSYQSIMEVFEKCKTVKMSYIYNYKTDTWYEVHRDGEVYEGECFSELLGMNMKLTTILYKQLSKK